MTCTVIDFDKDNITYHINGCSREELDNRLNLFFSSEKLPLRKDTPDEKVFRKGSMIARILLGVFVKYFKLLLFIAKENNDSFKVTIIRDMNFYMSGGLVGRVAARKEFERLNDAFKAYFNR
jgi:hypothetical protein